MQCQNKRHVPEAGSESGAEDRGKGTRGNVCTGEKEKHNRRMTRSGKGRAGVSVQRQRRGREVDS